MTCGLAVSQVPVSGPEGDCGFARLHPIRIVHYVERDAVNKVTPQYPPATKEQGVAGTVRVRILIDSQGLVEDACPEFLPDQRRPPHSLVIAAEAAALQWRFVPHFGFSTDAGLRFKYVEDVLVFDFVLDESKQSPTRPGNSPEPPGGPALTLAMLIPHHLGCPVLAPLGREGGTLSTLTRPCILPVMRTLAGWPGSDHPKMIGAQQLPIFAPLQDRHASTSTTAPPEAP
jgi:hypothetical protein